MSGDDTFAISLYSSFFYMPTTVGCGSGPVKPYFDSSNLSGGTNQLNYLK